MEYKEERISENTYGDIQSLKHRSMGYVQDMDDIVRKFDTSSFGSKNIGFFARDINGFPAAYYGVFPMRVVNNGVESVVAQSGDTMTDPDHRKKGLFVYLAKKTYEFAREQGIDFIFGFPNEFSYPGFKKKLDWVFYGNMQEFSIKTSAIPICELAKKYSAIRPLYAKILNRRLSKYIIELNDNNIKGFAHGEEEFFVKKSIEFYQYKSGDFKYLIEIDGFTLFIKVQTHLYIGDVGRFDESKVDLFISTLKKLSKLVYSRKVILTISKSHWLFNILQKRLVVKESLPIGFYKYEKEFPFDKFILSFSDSDTF